MNIKVAQKRSNVIIALIIIIIIAVSIIFYTENTASKNPSATKNLFSYSANSDSSSVFEALLDYGKSNNIEIKYNNNYEFGVFIESIGGIKNGDNGKYWQYYVNNKLGDVASDKKTITMSDIVEWRFENVPFEN